MFEATVAASSDGYAQALSLADEHAPGRRAFAVEGTGSFGAGLTRFLTGRGEQVLEVSRLRRERRSGGKTDALDAIRAARSVLAEQRPATPRAGGERQALQALVAAREGAVNAKRAGLVPAARPADHDPGAARGRAAAADTRAAAAAPRGNPARRQTRSRAARQLARAPLDRPPRPAADTPRSASSHARSRRSTRKLAPQLLDQPGVGPHAAAQLVLSWSHQGRITSEAAFARLAGAAPIPASSGQTIRYRLDRAATANSTAHCT